ncbi:MAG: glycoside hydrolase family 130 protein [Lentisphaeria bacterium]
MNNFIRSRTFQHGIFNRWQGNPVIELEDMPFRCADIRNAGAIKFKGKYLLLITVESLSGHTSIYRAHSGDGTRFDIEEQAFMEPSAEVPFRLHEEVGVMDPRITEIDNTYYITYLAESHLGFRTGLARTSDFRSLTRLGFISEPDTKGGTLFPEKIGARYARLERPSEGGRIWISYSDDLVYWGNSQVVLSPRSRFWDSKRVGDAIPPLKLSTGDWLMIYYGIRDTSAGALFKIGAAILDGENPASVKARANAPILAPQEKYERIGDVNNLVFSCGAIPEDDTLLVYYGAARSCICLGMVSITDIVNECEANLNNS